MSSLRFPKHPFPVRTVFRHCALANFRIEPDALARVLPEPLEPALAHGRAWLSVVIAEMEKLRPVGVPRALGFTYNQIVYRAVVDCDGRRGVHFLRSDADSRIMCLGGNLMSFFRFNHGKVDIRPTPSRLRVDANSRAPRPVVVSAEFDLAATSGDLPASSVFGSMDESKRFLVELFDAFAPRSGGNAVDLVSIERNDWAVRVVPNTGIYSFMGPDGPFGSAAELDSVFVVDDLHYRWSRLRTLDAGTTPAPPT